MQPAILHTQERTADGTWRLAVEPSDKWQRGRQTHRFVMAAGAVGGAFVLAGVGGPFDGPIICPLRLATGVPCPFCGMTTSFTHTAAGDFGEAFVGSPIGPLLFVAAIVIAAASAILLARRQRLDIRIPTKLLWAIGVPVVAAVWIYQIFRIGPLS